MAEEEGGAPYQFTPAGGKQGNSSRDYTGEGYAVYPNGDQYNGDYVNGERTGKGKYIYANGDRYDGFFKSNKKHGIGRLTSKEKGEYYGKYPMIQVSGKTESSMERAHMSMRIKISMLDGGCSARSTATGPTPTMRQEPNSSARGRIIKS